jgi:cyclic beta-1,2-glucan synthetase
MCVRKVHLTSFIRLSVGRALAPSPWDNRETIREELFSVERLEEHARSLAVAQTVTPKLTKGLPLASRLTDNAAVLLGAHRAIAAAIDAGHAITPAAEWLIDNYHLVERQIREIQLDLPAGYYRQLPKLADGPLVGYPRVFGVAWAFVAHTDSRFDSAMLCRYMDAYQEVQPLTIGELWAIAITLRIVLVENLRRIAARIVDSSAARREADGLADRLLGLGGNAAEPVAVVFADRERMPLPGALAVQLVQRLHDQDPRIIPALTWLDERLAVQGTTTDAVVHDEHQRQGAATVTVHNIITSMRMISDVDWTELFERISPVDKVLAAGSGFSDMDFPTRNIYRDAIEELARGSNRTELDIAHSAVLAAKSTESADASAEEDRLGDPGYHLLAGGRLALRRGRFRPPLHSSDG